MNTTEPVPPEGLESDARALLARARSLCPEPWLDDVVAFLAEQMARDGGHDYGHLWRVLGNCDRILKGEAEAGRVGPDFCWEAVVAAALLHDLVNLPKDHPKRHLASAMSAEQAVLFLSRCRGFPGLSLDRVGEAIRCHSFSSGLRAESLEARLVSDGDRLESIGAFAIARTFYVHGSMGGALCHFGDPFAETERGLDDQVYAVDHFYTKLLRLKDRLYTPTARQLAEHRHAFMQVFLAQLRDETPGETPE